MLFVIFKLVDWEFISKLSIESAEERNVSPHILINSDTKLIMNKSDKNPHEINVAQNDQNKHEIS